MRETRTAQLSIFDFYAKHEFGDFLADCRVWWMSGPTTTIADGCYASPKNVSDAKELGVKRVAFHRKNGITLSAMGIKEKTLRKLRDFRADIEANISELKRVFGAGKAMWKGENGFMAFVWSSVISYNLTHLVRMNSS